MKQIVSVYFRFNYLRVDFYQRKIGSELCQTIKIKPQEFKIYNTSQKFLNLKMFYVYKEFSSARQAWIIWSKTEQKQ